VVSPEGERGCPNNLRETNHSEYLIARNNVAEDTQWRVDNTSMNWPILFVVPTPAEQVHDQRANVEVRD
jgi:hypothetical protein